MKIVIDLEKCNGCGICEDRCPKKVYIIDDKTKKAIPVRKDFCTHCFVCASNCPQDAIRIILNEEDEG